MLGIKSPESGDENGDCLLIVLVLGVLGCGDALANVGTAPEEKHEEEGANHGPVDEPARRSNAENVEGQP